VQEIIKRLLMPLLH